MQFFGYVLFALTVSVFSIPAHSQALGERIPTSQYLTKGQYLVSQNKQYFAIMQGDGNFVVYRGSSPAQNGGFVWNTGTTSGDSFLIIQGDGNLVLYRGTFPGNNLGLVWQTGRTGTPGNPELKLANNGQLQVVSDDVVYWETPSDPRVSVRAKCKHDISQNPFLYDFANRRVTPNDGYIDNYNTYKQCLANSGTPLDLNGEWPGEVKNYCIKYFNNALLSGVDGFDYIQQCFANRWLNVPRLYINDYIDLYGKLLRNCNNIAIDKSACVNDKKPSLDSALSKDWPGASVAFNSSTMTMTTSYPSHYNPAPPATFHANLALGKPTSQTLVDYNGVSSRAVDGNTSGYWSSGSVTHTPSWLYQYFIAPSDYFADLASGEKNVNQRWEVNLKNDYPVTEVTLFNRTDCCTERLSNFNVDLLDRNGNVLATKKHAGQVGKKASFIFDGKVNARRVRVQKNEMSILSLAEVVVKANIAQGKPTLQSSTAYDGTSSRAVDGNTNGNWGASSVTHTGQEHKAWWRVDLQREEKIGEIVIWNRTDCCSDRLSNYVVEILNASQQVVHSIPVASTNGKTILSFSPINGRYVRVRLNGTNYLSLAEVQVFAAAPVGNGL